MVLFDDINRAEWAMNSEQSVDNIKTIRVQMYHPSIFATEPPIKVQTLVEEDL